MLKAVTRIIDDRLELRCDPSSAVCAFDDTHLHVLKLEMSQDRSRLTETFSLYRNGKPAEDLVFRFERKQQAAARSARSAATHGRNLDAGSQP